jgi:hypothetical protein
MAPDLTNSAPTFVFASGSLFADTLFWDQRAFDNEIRRSPLRYRLKKAPAASVVQRLYLQPV